VYAKIFKSEYFILKSEIISLTEIKSIFKNFKCVSITIPLNVSKAKNCDDFIIREMAKNRNLSVTYSYMAIWCLFLAISLISGVPQFLFLLTFLVPSDKILYIGSNIYKPIFRIGWYFNLRFITNIELTFNTFDTLSDLINIETQQYVED
jgi:hypothetical protein